MFSAVHVFGAGLAGLACATALAETGRKVTLYEATAQAGGRCRSFLDRDLGCQIDNGNHLVLSGNQSLFAYLDRLEARDGMIAITPAAFPFLDLRSGESWCLRPNAGPLPWWLANAGRRVPGTGLGDYLAVLRILTAGPADTVADRLDTSHPLFARLWGPLAVGSLNMPPDLGAARLMAAVLTRTFLKGEAACRPCVPRRSLGAALVEPALAFLERRGAVIRVRARLRRLEGAANRLTACHIDGERLPLGSDDAVVLALPPWTTATLVPGLDVPAAGETILNAHFRLPAPVRLPGGLPFLGLIGGTAEWLFARGPVVSVTVSAATRLAERPGADLAALLWRDAAQALEYQDRGQATAPVPPARIIKERRATFAQCPAGMARRPHARTRFANLFLAGDWTATGLPATLEGAVHSGETAARLVRHTTHPRTRGAGSLFSAFTLPRTRHI